MDDDDSIPDISWMSRYMRESSKPDINVGGARVLCLHPPNLHNVEEEVLHNG